MARDGKVYESLVRAWLNSDNPDSPQEALKALQEGMNPARPWTQIDCVSGQLDSRFYEY